MKRPTSSTNLQSTNTRHTRMSFMEGTLTRALIVKQGTHPSMIKEILNLRNSNQDPPVDLYDLKRSDEGDNEIDSLTKEPLDILLMGDEIISTNPARESDEFIKSSVDDLVPITKESEVTLVCDDLECNMPITIPLPTTNLREEAFDINSPPGEQVVDFLMENADVAGLPRHLVKQFFSHLVKHLSSTKRMSYEPLGNDSKLDLMMSLRTLVVWTPPESTPVIDESTLLVTPLLDYKEISLREVEIFDPFFSMTQSGGKTRVTETPSFGFHHIPSPLPVAYSPKEVMYRYYHPHLTSSDGFDHGPKMK
ncbi:hypothetical protein Tco_1252955 [Tanacetum coccineum]